MAAAAAVSLGVFLWFLLGRPSIEGRIHAISIGAGIIALMVVRALWPLAKPYLIDRVLFSSEEHTSELQSLMRLSSAVFRFKKHIHFPCTFSPQRIYLHGNKFPQPISH